jgi:xylulokinase
VPDAHDTVLTIDLGTSATKAAVWRGAELRGLTRAPLATVHPRPGYDEQDPREWWESVVQSCAELRECSAGDYADIDTIGFSAARETFALFDAALRPLGPGILWSDRRAEADAATMGDADAFRAATGVVLTGGAHAAKLAWVARHEPDELAHARWVLAPRDLVLARLTGTVVTDDTLASRTGLCAIDNGWLDSARAAYGSRLPPIVTASSVVGAVVPDAAGDLGLRRDTPVRVVAGAGDRACEVLGTGASPRVPMVSWGTTANVSVPHPGPASAVSTIAPVSRGPLGGYVVEAGVSAAGAAVGWLAALTGHAHDALLAKAASVEPGARGVVALPWFAGARAPWWRADAHAAFSGLSLVHGPAELARAVVEGVALDVARSLELTAPERAELVLAGAGAGDDLWRGLLAAVSGLPVVRRAVDDAASVGARLLVARARGESLHVDRLNPVVRREAPEPALVTAYRAVRAASDRAAAAALRSPDPSEA